MIIGQEALIDKINKLTLDTFPRSLLLVGEDGSGKHLMANHIKDHLHLDLIDISEVLTYETLSDISLKAEPAIYLIDSSTITIKDQNSILKFIEEPLKNAYIIILCENVTMLLSTVINRCQRWDMSIYSIDILKNFITPDSSINKILTIARTPGRIEILKGYDIDSMLSLANKIVTKIKNANYANMLKILDSLAFANEQGKYDPLIFIDFIKLAFMQEIKIHNDLHLINGYKCIEELSTVLTYPNCNKKYQYQYYLSKLWEIMQ